MCLHICTQGFAPPLFHKYSFRSPLDLNEGLTHVHSSYDSLCLYTGMAASNMSKIVNLNDVSYRAREHSLRFALHVQEKPGALSLQSTVPGYSTILESKPA